MSVNIRYPNITGFSEREQLTQVKSYLHQLVDQLNYALPTIGTSEGAESTTTTKTVEVQGGELSYYELRSLIIQEIQKIDALFEQLSKKIYADVDTVVENSLRESKESGEFDGKDGIGITDSVINADGELVVTYSDGTSDNLGKVVGADGHDGQPGNDGQDGKMPVYGEDFVLTDDEINTIATQAAGKISFYLDEETGELYYEIPDSEVVEEDNTNNEVEE